MHTRDDNHTHTHTLTITFMSEHQSQLTVHTKHHSGILTKIQYTIRLCTNQLRILTVWQATVPLPSPFPALSQLFPVVISLTQVWQPRAEGYVSPAFGFKRTFVFFVIVTHKKKKSESGSAIDTTPSYSINAIFPCGVPRMRTKLTTCGQPESILFQSQSTRESRSWYKVPRLQSGQDIPLDRLSS